jgi:hypothetical protein
MGVVEEDHQPSIEAAFMKGVYNWGFFPVCGRRNIKGFS